MPNMSVRSYFSKLERSLKEKNASHETRLGQHMACRAAIYLLYGQDGEDFHNTLTDIDSEAVTYYANKLLTMDPSIKDYAVRCYGGIDPKKVDMKNLKFEYFLYHNLDKLQLPTLTEMAVRPGLRKTLKNRERNDNLSCADHWYSRWPDQEAARNRGDHQEKDESVYQYEAPDSVWKDYLAASYLADNMGVISTKDIVRNSNRRNNPFDKLTLRNKQTVEKVQRGEFSAIRQARKDTEASFTFRREKDLREAQEAAQRLDGKMYLCVGDVADSQEWKAVRSAVQKFGKAKDPAAAAEASAKVLLAVEKFTKGKKNAKQSSDVKACVDLAMQALGTTIPDAARNPSVKPLVDRFNDVRAFRFQKPVDIGSNKYLSVSSNDSEAKSYTFLRRADLEAAQNKALDLHQQMQVHADAMSGNPEWGKMTQALQKFIVANDKVNAAIASSDLMDAVEKFTKGKKNLNQTPAVAACVDLAMKALGAAIPNAAEHARVIPLVDRFNEVRDKRGQAHIDIDANQSFNTNASTREFLDRQREKLGRFMTGVLNAPGARVIYDGKNREPIMMLMDEQELRKNSRWTRLSWANWSSRTRDSTPA